MTAVLFISELEERALNHFLTEQSKYPAIDLSKIKQARKSTAISDLLDNIAEDYAHFTVKTFLTEFDGVLYDLRWAYDKGRRISDVVKKTVNILQVLGYEPVLDRRKNVISFPAFHSTYFKEQHKQIIRVLLKDNLKEFRHVTKIQHIFLQ